ncbi:hypothetical protein ACY2EZ_002792 [Listeria innocua]|uniref:hypothetical protein n=1 Tax=Bacilli TaxID=91061 RepID=UPI0016502716|nr:hypothetical protein [Listeria innocua]HBN5116539.1 hypothetical protein [Listeria innocua]HBN5117053.1 hypothetical protein [Listeria innocua]HCJ4513454.1 hypothetical protein [Listeria innocua]HCJ4869517.1 hypothetical protein [Listeria innocua]
MNKKVVNIAEYRKKSNKKKNYKNAKSYEEIISEEYAEDLANEFKKILSEEKSDK